MIHEFESTVHKHLTRNDHTLMLTDTKLHAASLMQYILLNFVQIDQSELFSDEHNGMIQLEAVPSILLHCK